MLRLIRAPGLRASSDRDELLKVRQGDVLRSLASKAATGDDMAARTLLAAVGPAVLTTVRRVLGTNHPEVDDTYQEASIGLLCALPNFRAQCTVLHFACRVALLTALAARRRMRRQGLNHQELNEECDDLQDDQPSAADMIDSARRRNCVRRLLDELPLPQAEVLALHAMLGHTVEETSALMGAPINTVRSWLRRGLNSMREALDADGSLSEIVGGHHD